MINEKCGMSNDKKTNGDLHTLIQLDDFKAVLGLDDREDKISRFCLVASTLTIEQYCKRRLLSKKHFEYIDFYEDLIISLKEYPVLNVAAVYSLFANSQSEFIEHEFYQVIPDCGCNENVPFSLSLSPALKKYRGLIALKVVYSAGYSLGKVPPDLASACLELAAWNMNRYRGRRIGMTGNVRGNSKDGEHFELSMPENVRFLLEPYRRKVI
jgi:hypothetical protein